MPSSNSDPPNPEKCPVCQGANNCALAQGKSKCWCFYVEVPAELRDAGPPEQCLCESCLGRYPSS